METTGALTGYIDVAQLTLYAFWIFFFGLVFYLRREDKREGYPLDADGSIGATGEFFPPVPAPKTFLLPHGRGTVQVPPGSPLRGEIRARPTAPWPGAPLEPTGNPMLDGVGPASYVLREDKPEFTLDGEDLIVPMRGTKNVRVDTRDPDPRGMEVIGADRQVAGKVSDLWVDRSEPQIRYLEVEVAANGRRVLLPMPLARIQKSVNEVRVASITAAQFADVPDHKDPDRVTKREEDRIMGYFAGGKLYATPQRLGPML